MSKPQGDFPTHIDVRLLQGYDPAVLKSQAAVYVIHFNEPVCHARHYIGYVKSDVRGRLLTHARGLAASSKLLIHLHSLDIGWRLVRLQLFGTDDEAARLCEQGLKRQKSLSTCPLCIDLTRQRARLNMRRLRAQRTQVC